MFRIYDIPSFLCQVPEFAIVSQDKKHIQNPVTKQLFTGSGATRVYNTPIGSPWALLVVRTLNGEVRAAGADVNSRVALCKSRCLFAANGPVLSQNTSIASV